MKITEALLRDHKMFYEEFGDLEKAFQSGASLPEIEAQLESLSTALDIHAQLEDELLFAAMEPIIGPTGPLTVMRMEHSEIENIFSLLQESSDVATTEGFISRLLEVARPHFAKEEQILFPMAEKVLDPNTLEQLGVQFSNRRRVVMI